VHLEAGRIDEARDCLARARDIHSELAPARVLLARTWLAEFDATGSIEALRTGLQKATTVSVEHPACYNAAVTLAELQLALGRAARDVATLTDALATLDRAQRLDGCGNRIAYLRARTRLERAQLTLATGADATRARADLDAVLALRNTEHTQGSDTGPWPDLLARAERVRAELPNVG
jgi:hypothetical protein